MIYIIYIIHMMKPHNSITGNNIDTDENES